MMQKIFMFLIVCILSMYGCKDVAVELEDENLPGVRIEIEKITETEDKENA